MRSGNVVIGQKVDEAKVQRARQFRRELTETEQILWRCLRGNRMAGYHFRRQQVIDGFIADFYCHQAGLVLEVDGESHNEQTVYDEARGRILAARGLLVVRVTNDEVRGDLSGVLARIRADLTSRPPSQLTGKRVNQHEEGGDEGEEAG